MNADRLKDLYLDPIKRSFYMAIQVGEYGTTDRTYLLGQAQDPR